ncbi:MAG: DNA polymerase III subunit chi [Paracoccus sp. (in: a-proteobacteria)]|uniref:DNA polymerase III subunit chi n=1 Tax=Paracoccus sp. TaxID=267 RepID=UPI0026E0B8C0|nr:DNA polymerase III subunit chi [Paracoccus sp. (in: a-proteobacteria)]MDO5621442.1 DNA polymerase III subunit chi [Paracoccus sp. (in: a-proteobacteria)]
MGAALFYHLTRSPAEALLPQLIGKARQAGWRVELRARSRDLAERLDQVLWQGDGFLPHGLAGGPHDARQPVLLTIEGQEAGPVACLMAVEGAEVSASDCTGAERVCIIFDGNNPAAVQRARDQWRELTGAGIAAEYWAEDGGRWEKKSASGQR